MRAPCFTIAIVCLASPASAWSETVDLVRVDKSDRILELISNGKVVGRYPIALGGNPVGHKGEEGDERTPVGRYVLDWRNPESGYHRSIHISYPNAQDRAAAAFRGVDPGGMIMIHGQPNGFGWWSWFLQNFDWTDGCIAVENDHMDEIWQLVANGTAIEIAE
ncbi:MAG: L,D-transpeptidase family protein [Pseudomonadota bacterium]